MINMKMQNTEMEFVTFDAQDVIATSGTPTAVQMDPNSTYTFFGILDTQKGNFGITQTNAQGVKVGTMTFSSDGLPDGLTRNTPFYFYGSDKPFKFEVALVADETVGGGVATEWQQTFKWVQDHLEGQPQ